VIATAMAAHMELCLDGDPAHVAHTPEVFFSQRGDGPPLLHRVRCDDPSVIEPLMRFAAHAPGDPANGVHREARPLHSAVKNDLPNFVAALLGAGADPNAASDGVRPLYLALTTARTPDIIGPLLRSADLTLVGVPGRPKTGEHAQPGASYLHAAAQHADAAHARELLDRGADPHATFDDGTNRMPLHIALEFGVDATAAELVRVTRTDVRAQLPGPSVCGPGCGGQPHGGLAAHAVRGASARCVEVVARTASDADLVEAIEINLEAGVEFLPPELGAEEAQRRCLALAAALRALLRRQPVPRLVAPPAAPVAHALVAHAVQNACALEPVVDALLVDRGQPSLLPWLAAAPFAGSTRTVVELVARAGADAVTAGLVARLVPYTDPEARLFANGLTLLDLGLHFVRVGAGDAVLRAALQCDPPPRLAAMLKHPPPAFDVAAADTNDSAAQLPLSELDTWKPFSGVVDAVGVVIEAGPAGGEKIALHLWSLGLGDTTDAPTANATGSEALVARAAERGWSKLVDEVRESGETRDVEGGSAVECDGQQGTT